MKIVHLDRNRYYGDYVDDEIRQSVTPGGCYAKTPIIRPILFHLVEGNEDFLLKATLIGKEVCTKKHPYIAQELPKITIPATRITFQGEVYPFSDELLNGIEGKRGCDHLVVVETLEKCVRKKHARLQKNKGKHESTFDFYFFDTAQEAVLNVIFKKYATQTSYMILTAYYPTRSMLRSRYNASEIRLDYIIKELPKV